MVLYIASSWKHRHAVELLTKTLRNLGHEVRSFIENHNNDFPPRGNFNQWIASADGERCFKFDTESIQFADAVIYISPSGCDTWAEVGLAYGCNIPVYGLSTHKEEVGLMRKMVVWFDSVSDLVRKLSDETF